MSIVYAYSVDGTRFYCTACGNHGSLLPELVSARYALTTDGRACLVSSGRSIDIKEGKSWVRRHKGFSKMHRACLS
jgi:hypothetical protein